VTLPDFEQAYDEHAWRVFGFFAYRVATRADAEDLTQRTFERALGARERFDEHRASLATWLMAIARNLLIDHYRAAGLRDNVPLDDVAEAALPRVQGPEAKLGLAPELALALDQMSDREREILALRFGADLNGPEIAAIMELSLANVQQITSRALRRLRVILDQRPTSDGGRPRITSDRSERQRADVRHAEGSEPNQQRAEEAVGDD
jgi:RNA polymerase sigma factor (sigma-70 family)